MFASLACHYATNGSTLQNPTGVFTDHPKHYIPNTSAGGAHKNGSFMPHHFPSSFQTLLWCLSMASFSIPFPVVLTKTAVSCLTTFLPLSRPFSGACLWLLFLFLSEWCSQKRQFHVSPLRIFIHAPCSQPVSSSLRSYVPTAVPSLSRHQHWQIPQPALLSKLRSSA